MGQWYGDIRYKDAQEATAELRVRGVEVTKQRDDSGSRLEGKLRNTFQWQRETIGGEGDLEVRTQEKLQE